MIYASFLSLADAMKAPHGSVVDVIGVLCHVGMLYRCLSSGAWVREIAVKDHSRVVFLRILTDFTDTSFRMLLNSCANRSCVLATKVIVDQFTGT